MFIVSCKFIGRLNPRKKHTAGKLNHSILTYHLQNLSCRPNDEPALAGHISYSMNVRFLPADVERSNSPRGTLYTGISGSLSYERLRKWWLLLNNQLRRSAGYALGIANFVCELSSLLTVFEALSNMIRYRSEFCYMKYSLRN